MTGVRASYPAPIRRNALAPSLLAVIALIAGVALIDGDAFVIIRYVVAILALVVAVFAWQARMWWWLIGLVPIAVLWNPVWPIQLPSRDLWLGLQYVAALVFIPAGILITTKDAG